MIKASVESAAFSRKAPRARAAAILVGRSSSSNNSLRAAKCDFRLSVDVFAVGEQRRLVRSAMGLGFRSKVGPAIDLRHSFHDPSAIKAAARTAGLFVSRELCHGIQQRDWQAYVGSTKIAECHRFYLRSHHPVRQLPSWGVRLGPSLPREATAKRLMVTLSSFSIGCEKFGGWLSTTAHPAKCIDCTCTLSGCMSQRFVRQGSVERPDRFDQLPMPPCIFSAHCGRRKCYRGVRLPSPHRVQFSRLLLPIASKLVHHDHRVAQSERRAPGARLSPSWQVGRQHRDACSKSTSPSDAASFLCIACRVELSQGVLGIESCLGTTQSNRKLKSAWPPRECFHVPIQAFHERSRYE